MKRYKLIAAGPSEEADKKFAFLMCIPGLNARESVDKRRTLDPFKNFTREELMMSVTEYAASWGVKQCSK